MKNVEVVVPIFNEEGVIKRFALEMQKVISNLPGYKFRIIFVNDGSTDNSSKEVESLSTEYFEVTCINFSRNFGKEAAITAGLEQSRADAVIPIDVDLQDPPELIVEMLKMWSDGAQMVLAKRSSRHEDRFFKRASAKIFYSFLGKHSNPKIPANVGDFRLMDRKVVDAVNLMPEANRFMKGIFAWVGFNVQVLEYSRPKRIEGKTKFNFFKLWSFGIEGITSFSTRPLKVWTYLGLLVSTLSIAFAIYLVFRVVFLGVESPGYASTMVAITLIGGLQLMGIGVLGEYVARIFLESKRRPAYLVSYVYNS